MSRIRSPQDAAAGLFLLVLGSVALWEGASLSAGSIGQIGPGMLPRALAVLNVLGGIGLFVGAFFIPGPRLERWRLRGVNSEVDEPAFARNGLDPMVFRLSEPQD